MDTQDALRDSHVSECHHRTIERAYIEPLYELLGSTCIIGTLNEG